MEDAINGIVYVIAEMKFLCLVMTWYVAQQNHVVVLQFGKLLVIDIARRTKNGVYWNCVCDCGNNTVVLGKHLRKGDTKSCGCISKDVGVQLRKLDGEAAFNTLYYSYERRAKLKNMEFSLSREYFKELTKQNCHYCSQEPYRVHYPRYQNGSYTYNGIDRVDSSIGYTKENCVPCCYRCNVAKSNVSLDDFITWAFRLHDSLVSQGIEPKVIV
jgi:hypothetical protein